MRDSLSCSVSLRHFGVWRAAVAAVAVAALAALFGWAASAPDPQPPSAWLCIGVVAVTILLLAASLACVEGGTLRLRSGVWTFAPSGRDDSAEAGVLAVAVDLGSFMLLCLVRRGTGRIARRRWLPAQRRGLERDWHALRCAVYSPPPAAAPTLAADQHPSE